jgi:hypothetical protein
MLQKNNKKVDKVEFWDDLIVGKKQEGITIKLGGGGADSKKVVKDLNVSLEDQIY